MEQGYTDRDVSWIALGSIVGASSDILVCTDTVLQYLQDLSPNAINLNKAN